MTTNAERLQVTLRHARELWARENARQSRNAVNEGAWSVQVIEPLLDALGWNRLRRSERKGNGAFFEWPGKHAVDVALLHSGNPDAFIELKKSRLGSGNDLPRKLQRHRELWQAGFAVSSWFERGGGFDVYAVGPGGTIALAHGDLRLDDTSLAVETLARLAEPAIRGTALDVKNWLLAPTSLPCPAIARVSPREVQAVFFSKLCEKLKLSNPLELRHRTTVKAPPTPTYAFTELPGIFPAGWGLVLDFDNTMNRMNCFFFEGTDRQVSAVRYDFDDLPSPFDNGVVDRFIEDLVLPAIEKIRVASA